MSVSHTKKTDVLIFFLYCPLTGKLNLLYLIVLNNSAATHVKVEGLVLDRKSSFKMLGLRFSSKLTGILRLALLLKLCLQENGNLRSFYGVSFLCFTPVNPQEFLEWTTAAMSGSGTLVASWICWISCPNACVQILYLHLLLQLKH